MNYEKAIKLSAANTIKQGRALHEKGEVSITPEEVSVDILGLLGAVRFAQFYAEDVPADERPASADIIEHDVRCAIQRILEEADG